MNNELIYKKLKLGNDVLVVSNARNKFILKQQPFSIRNINSDVVKILEQINSGLTLTEIGIVNNYSIAEKEKLLTLTDTLYNYGVLEDGNNMKENVIRKSISAYPLERLFISITENCNLRCKHCYVECNDQKITEKDMLLETLFYLISQGVELGTWQVDLTGGEIFCRKDIFKILDFLKKKNVIVNLFTNATLIDESIANKLGEYTNITRIIISFDSLNKNVYEEFRQAKDGFNKLINALNLIKSQNINMSFNVSYMNENKAEVEHIIEFLSKNYSSDIIIYPIIPFGRGSNIKELGDMESLCKIKKKQRAKFADNNCNKLMNCFNTSCGVSESFIFVESSGELALCPTLSHKYDSKLKIGNINEIRLDDVWNNNELINQFRLSNCKYINSCVAKKECKGGCRCRAYFESRKSLNGIDKLSCLIHDVDIIDSEETMEVV